jgi:hypothetical protein
MKIQQIISMKAVTTIMLMATLLIISSCQSQEKNSDQDKLQTSISPKKIKPPVLDIHAATFLGDIEAIQQHIKAGTDLNIKDEYGSTPLIISVVFDKSKVAVALIEAGADVNLKSDEGSTPLHSAAFFCRMETARALLNNGADKSIKNNYGSTPLETVAGPFNEVKSIYDQISKDLGPLGFKLDYGYLEVTRPKMAEMLK